MKLRIKGNSIRLRLTKSEVESFGRDGIIGETVDFGGQNDSPFGYLLEQNRGRDLCASFSDGKIKISVPRETAERWVGGEEVGIGGGAGILQILIEKDFVCLNPRADEDESDNFPHPAADRSC